MIHRVICTVQTLRLFILQGTAWCSLVSCAVAVALFTRPTAIHAQATFTPLGQFGGVSSSAFDISADGSVIVGSSIVLQLPAATISVFRMTPQGATVRPTGLTGSEFSRPPAVSADGSTIVGTFQSPGGEEAFRWVGDGPLEGLGDLAGGNFQSNAFGVSGDGSVVVGVSESNSGPTAFRWTATGGMVNLGANERSARGVSADGSVVVGSLSVGEDPSTAYRWTMQTGSMILPPLPRPRYAGADAHAVTSDGSAVVGFNTIRFGLSSFTAEAFRWTEQEGTISLQSSGWDRTVARDVSADGSAVVGSGSSPTSGGTDEAFYWTPEIGMVELRELLIFGGATNLDGWHLSSAYGVTADGRTVVGRAFGPNGQEAFVATIGAIPEPSSVVLAAFAVAGIVCFARSKRGCRVQLRAPVRA